MPDRTIPIEIVHVQSVLPADVVKALKDKSGKSNVKDALAMAVYAFIAPETKSRGSEIRTM